MSSQLQASAILPSGKAPPICVEYEAGWAQSRTGRFGENQDIPDVPSRCLVAVSTEPTGLYIFRSVRKIVKSDH